MIDMPANSSIVDYDVIIPARNEECFLPICVKAIRRSADLHAGNVRISVVSDSSTDSTAQVAAAMGCTLMEVSVGSRAIARNMGASKCVGSYVVFIDADTMVSEDFFSRITEVFEQDTDVIWFRQQSLEEGVLASLWFATMNFVSRYRPLFCPVIAVRSSYFQRNCFDERLGSFEDLFYLSYARRNSRSQYCTSTVHSSSRRIYRFGILRALLYFGRALWNPYTYQWKPINE